MLAAFKLRKVMLNAANIYLFVIIHTKCKYIYRSFVIWVVDMSFLQVFMVTIFVFVVVSIIFFFVSIVSVFVSVVSIATTLLSPFSLSHVNFVCVESLVRSIMAGDPSGYLFELTITVAYREAFPIN